MTNTSLTKDQIELSKKLGSLEIEESSSDFEIKMKNVFSENPKLIFTSKKLLEILKEKDLKFFSDKCWNLEKKGFLEKCSRGQYRLRGGKSS